MGLQDDWNELKKMWGNCSLATRIFLAVSFFLSCASVSSLADGVFQFRGFLQTAIEFYRIPIDYIVEVLYINWGWFIPPSAADTFVLICLFEASRIKVGGGFQKGWLYEIAIITFLAFFIMFMEYITYDPTLVISFAPGFLVVMSGIFFYLGFVHPVAGQTKRAPAFKKIEIAPGDRRMFRLVLGNILTILFLVAVVAAISEGLTRPL